MIITAIVPRVSETDGAGHINNCFVPVWFEAGRREIFQLFTPDLTFTQWRVMLVSMTVDYEAQIYFQHEVEVRTWIARVGTKSFTVAEELWQEGRRCARGTATYVCYQFMNQSSEQIPADTAEALNAISGP